MPTTKSLYPNLNEVKQITNPKMATHKTSVEFASGLLCKFDGSKSKLFEFIDNCDQAYEIVKDEFKPMLFAVIKTKLTDNARAIVRNRNFLDWSSLKNHLVDTYTEKRTRGQWQLELCSCRQNFGESVLSFSNKVENCYIKLLSTLDETLDSDKREIYSSMFKEQALNVFIAGLNKDLSLITKSQKPNSLEMAISLAMQEEQEQKSKLEISKFQNLNINNSKPKSHTSPYDQKKPNHFYYTNPTSYTAQTTRNGTNAYSNFKNNVRHVDTEQPKTCTYCKKSGHTLDNCRQNEFCNYCKKTGHEIRDCRKRKFNNTRRELYESIKFRPTGIRYNDFVRNPNSLNSTAPSQKANVQRVADFIQATYQ